MSEDERIARKLLILLAEDGRLTPGIAVALAEYLCHIAGGDGRGVFRIIHDPAGDRL